MNRVHVLIGLAACAACLTAPAVSRAQGGVDPAAARSLFDDAKALVAANRIAEACPKFEESQRLDPGIGTQFNLADCYERLGRTASAWSAFLEVASKAQSSGQQARENAARERAAALVPRLSKLTIVVPPASRVEGLSIARDGVAVREPGWGSAVVVDPGKHRIIATAPGRKQWQSEPDVAANGGTATVTIPPLELDGGAAAMPVKTDVGAAPVGDTTPTSARQSPLPQAGPEQAEQTSPGKGSLQRTIGIATAGLGVVGLGLGTYFGLSSRSKQDEVKSHCDNYPDGCDAEGLALNDDAKKAGTLATVSFIAGGVFVAGGAVLYLTAPSDAPKTGAVHRVRIAPALGMRSGGLSLQGQW